MRDWQKDWELCEKATPGPWDVYVREDSMSIYDILCGYSEKLESDVWITFPPQSVESMADAYDDAEFIAEAREALPYWLKRVKELEKKNKKLQDDIAKLRKAVEIGQKWIGKVIRYLGYEQAEIDYLDVHEILRSIPLPDYGSGSITLED